MRGRHGDGAHRRESMQRVVDGGGPGIDTFVYSGDEGQRLLQIGDSREVAIGDPGSVFMDFAAAGGGLTNVGEVMYDVASKL